MAFESIKEQIKQAPLSQVIQYFIPLNRKGQNLEAICPFHADTKPSLKVNDEKGIYKCFACGAAGDAINFVKEFKKIDFIDALKECAQLLGISIDELQKSKKKNPKMEMGFRVLNAATKIYRKFGEQELMEFKLFVKNRQLSLQSIENFLIGFAPQKSTIAPYLQQIPTGDRDLAIKSALEMGLIRVSQKHDGHYDFFRERIIFPIHDHQGQVRGFSSRALHSDQVPKYLNSGDSFIFHKGSILFGYYQAKNAIRQHREVILVEGHMDVIMMHQHGFQHTVGTMGTALTEQNVKLLSHLAPKIFLGMDADEAGLKAQQKINHDLMAREVLAYHLDFSPAKDPDDFLNQYGRLALKEKMDNAPLVIDFLLQKEIPLNIPENINVKLQIMNRVFQLLAPLKDHLQATERIMQTAKMIQLRSDAASIIEDYRQFLAQHKEKFQASPTRTANEEALEEEQKPEEPVIQEEALAHPLQEEKIAPLHAGEKILIKTLLSHPECLEVGEIDEILAYVMHPEVKQMIPWLCKIYQEIDEREYESFVSQEFLGPKWSDEIKKIVADTLFSYSGLKLNPKVRAQLLKDLKLKVQMEKLREKRKEYAELQKSCETVEQINFYMNEIIQIDRELHQLKQ